MRRWMALLVLAALVTGVALSAGCGAAPAVGTGAAPASKQTEAAARPEASEILKRLLATYRQAKSYSDEGKVRLSFRQNGELVEEEWNSAVKFQRPNRLAVKAFQATLACDGRELRAQIDDAATNHLDGQMLVRPAPQELQLKDLAGDPLLYDILSSQLRRQPIQLELLLESSGLASAFGEDIACKSLGDAAHDGRSCYRVEVPSPGGPFIFWVDQADFLLRRLEYPAAALMPDVAHDPAVSELSLSADLSSAAINGNIDSDEFVLDIPEGARRMKSLVVPPRPLPSELFGKRPDDFFLTTAGGETLQRDELSGKISVLVWFRDHPACEATLQQVERVRKEYEEEPEISFNAISTDQAATTSGELARLLESWQVALPLVRDLEAFGDSVFKIQVQPTLIVLDRQGRVQIVQAGGSPDLARQLGVILERLLKGEDLAADILAKAAAERAEYEKLLAAGGPEPSELLELPEAVIKKRSEPQMLRLTELWSNKDLKLPGNLYVLSDAGGPPRILVVEGWRNVTALDGSGKIVNRHELPIPEQAAITYLRTATDRENRRFYLAAAPLAAEFYLLDENWQLVRTLAGPDGVARLSDLQIERVSEDQRLVIYAGYLDFGGLWCFGLDGEVLWKNRTFPSVLGLALAPGGDEKNQGGVFLTGESGAVLAVDSSGKETSPRQVGKYPLVRIQRSSVDNAENRSLLGIGGDSQGQVFAVGMSSKLAAQWEYLLPPGAHQKPIEPIASGPLLPNQAETWAIAGPDGAIHLINGDGKVHDRFYSGAAVSGIAIANLQGRSVLLLATDDGVTAWLVE